MAENLVTLALIDPNPWQPRTNEDVDHIANLAVSIADDGLMQVPRARRVGTRYQLAFGHSRLAAYRLLMDLQTNLEQGDHVLFEADTPMARALAAARVALENGNDFGGMPVNVMEIDDEAMFRFAVSENVQRRDLSPIETAKAMLRYRDEFGKTSADIGALFGVNDATVRGKLRLLDLPEQVQNQLNQGELSEGTARTLLTARRVLGDEKLAELAEKLADFKNPEEVLDVVDNTLRMTKNVVHLFNERYQHGKPQAGQHLWPLTWTFAGPDFPTQKEAAKGWAGPKKIAWEYAGLRHHDTIETIFQEIARGGALIAWDAKEFSHPEWKDAIAYLRQLAEPPACTVCPLYSKLDGSHFCGMKACWSRKRRKWIEAQFADDIARLGLAVYDADADGEGAQIVGNYADADEHNQLWRGRIAAHDPELRLKINFQEYSSSADKITGSFYSSLVDVSPARLAKRKQEQLSQIKQDDWARERELREAADRFVEEHAYQAFGNVFDALKKLYPMMALASVDETRTDNGFDRYWKGLGTAEKLEFLRKQLAKHALNYVLGWSIAKQGPVSTAKHLKGVALTWGVKLPENWLEVAASYEPFAALESVAVETVNELDEAEAE